MSCPNCKCESCRKQYARTYMQDLTSSDRYRYRDPRFWCSCGAWKYDDASCCTACAKEYEGWADR